ncbi:MAG TPA: ATP-binding protein [Kofleriaceae bacterium]|nr:ATP-binding protein [Kofleriaceae bacterium]
MNVLALSALLASLVTLAIGASVLLRDRTRRTYTSFAAFTFMVSAYHLCSFVAMATESPLAEWLALWPAATIPPTALAFFREFIAQPSIGGPRRPPRVTLAWTVAAYIGLLYSAIVHPIHDELYFQIPFAAYVFGGLYRCVYDLYVQYRATQKRVERTRIRYLMIGGLVSISLAVTDVLPRFGIAWPTIGNVLTILYLYFLSQTLFRYRLIDDNELVGKMAVLGTLVVLLWAVYGLLLNWVGGGQDGLFLLTALVASFVILILFEPVRTRLENGINRWLVRQRHELRGSIEALRRELTNVVDVGEMNRRIIAALEESRRVTDAAVYLLDSPGAGYDLAGKFGAHAPVDRLEAVTHRALLDRLRDGYLDAEVIRRELQNLEGDGGTGSKSREGLQNVLRTLDEMRAGQVFAMYGSEKTEQGPWLLGLLAVRDERAEDAFDGDDIDMFRQLAGQAARTIEASQVYERVKERDRLAAIGEMSAGLAHEIRNPLGAIKGAAQLLVGPDGKPINPADAGEFLTIIIDEVNRLNNVVTQFLDYARLQKSEPSGYGPIDVNDVVRKTSQLLLKDEALGTIEVDVRLDELLPPVAGDPEQLRQVFLNLGLNALHAMNGAGKLEITTSRRRRTRLGYGSFAEIRFRDTGVGIPRENIKNLFIPFFTTKEQGTGLGLAISQRIVSQHAGSIEVRSTQGKGSTFSVFLPALGPSPVHPETEPAGPRARLDTPVRQPAAAAQPAGDAAPAAPPAPAAPSTS